MKSCGWIVLLLSVVVPPSWAEISAPSRSPATEYADAVISTEQKVFQDAFANRSIANRNATEEFVAGLVGGAWRLSNAARHLETPAFSIADEFSGQPGLYNPDNIYRSALLDESASYRIAGIRGSHAHLTFQFIDSFPLIGLSKDLLVIDLDDYGVGAGDAFELFIGGTRKNSLWWPMPAGAHAVLVRQTFNDWQNETPTKLQIERSPLPSTIPPAPDRLTLAATYLRQMTGLWVERYMQGLRRLPVNVMPPVQPSKEKDGGLSGQQSVIGRFELDDEHALIITSRLTSATYQAIQLGNYWFVTPNPIRHQSSLNRFQSVVGEDGELHYVISLKDPGVANWLDPGGSREGYFMLRWQGLSESLAVDELPLLKRVRIDELDSHLGRSDLSFSESQRAQQLQLRRSLPMLR